MKPFSSQSLANRTEYVMDKFHCATRQLPDLGKLLPSPVFVFSSAKQQ